MNPFELAAHIRALEQEINEQSRLNGMGSEREARLMAKVAELERENAALRAERDSYRFRSEQIWGLRKEIQGALGVASDCEGEEALKQGLAAIKTLRSDKERLDSGRIRLKFHVRGDVWKVVDCDNVDLRAAIDAARKEAQP